MTKLNTKLKHIPDSSKFISEANKYFMWARTEIANLQAEYDKLALDLRDALSKLEAARLELRFMRWTIKILFVSCAVFATLFLLQAYG